MAIQAYTKVKSVEALAGKRLRVIFSKGTVKLYDCTPLMTEPTFRSLNNEALFQIVRPDKHGYGVVWNDEVDLAESELWLFGSTENTAEPDK